MFELGILILIFATSVLLIGPIMKRQPAGSGMPFAKPENTGVGHNPVRKEKMPVAGKNPALPVDASDRFIQTMSTTFAHLQVGIAVFDRQNELALFNPALTQHLGLRPEWLLKKPNLLGFLDRLRDTNILPEPKNYTSWRKTFMKIERSAMKDDYREDWGLPDGRSLRVIGRPHPSGTVVFLFEDVTATLAMERGFRAQVSNLENILNTATTGLVAFDRNGKLIYMNHTLKQVFGGHGDFKSIQDFSHATQSVFHPTPIWGDLRQYVEDTERSAWQASVETTAGEAVLVRVEPVSTGATLCEFHFPVKINQGQDVGLACAAQ
ncbi:MAG: PAS domain-containing protein [Proteobacteria bacterium]|nr:PAS domain-containing protein [Pseudomonadota bacterium]